MLVEGQAIFLSASVPLPSRNRTFFETADVIAIRDSVRSLVMIVIESNLRLIFGGHPAITPMIRAQLTAAGSGIADRFTLYQSEYFSAFFPDSNREFGDTRIVPSVGRDKDASLAAMRQVMLDRGFAAGVFIGGMEGVLDEFGLFTERHPAVPVYPVASTGAAAAILFDQYQERYRLPAQLKTEVSYLSLMRFITTEAFSRQPGLSSPEPS